MTSKEKFIDICNLTTNVLGLKKGSLSYKSRKQHLQLARMVAGVIGRIEEGIHHKIIGEVLKRDRSLIYHYEKSHSGNYTFDKYRNIFNKVYTAYKQLQSTKQIFTDKYYMKEYLLKNGVKESKKSEVHIAIKSGKISTIIQTSYMDFSNQLEIIKLALRNHHYQIEIL
jgi:hypothetical protein